MRTTVSVWLAYMNRGTSSSFPPSKVVIDAIELTWQSSTFLRHEEQCKRKERRHWIDRDETTAHSECRVDTEEELFLGTCDSRRVGAVGVLVSKSKAKNIDPFEQVTTLIGHLQMRRCGLTTALTNFVAYAPKSSCGEDVEAFYMDLRALAIPEALLSTLDMGVTREAIKEDFKERRAEVLAEDAEAGKSIRSARQEFANRKTRMSALWNPYGIATASGKGMEKILSRGSPETSETVLLYKKGDPHDIGNYRPICLLSVTYKLFTRVLLNRIEKVREEGQPCEQAGFRKGFSTIDHIHTVSKLIEVSREYKMPLCLTGLKKAFDSVETEAVVEALDNQGVPTQNIKVLRELYSNFTTGISPFYKNIIIERNGSGGDGRQLHHLRFYALRIYADIVLITSSIR
ncbi:hypothetical protein RB195_017738 [Necator americanus]|uniref:Reverse transcriptase domain-containing protein n=2 Tax=Necator americanus TaxID=51031 RepID=A0ABR1C8W8_NECAM